MTIITESETAVRTAVSAETPPEQESTRGRARPRASVDPETAPSAVSAAVTRRSRLARAIDRLTPPEPWQHRPASLAMLYRYAKRGGWAGPDSGARKAMTWWVRLVAIPITVLCHYTAWIVARPGRAATVAVLWAVLMQIRPLRAAADAVLPWPAWPIG